MTESADETVLVEVTLPNELLVDIDHFATRNGYENPSAVVREALHSPSRHTSHS